MKRNIQEWVCMLELYICSYSTINFVISVSTLLNTKSALIGHLTHARASSPSQFLQSALSYFQLPVGFTSTVNIGVLSCKCVTWWHTGVKNSGILKVGPLTRHFKSRVFSVREKLPAWTSGFLTFRTYAQEPLQQKNRKEKKRKQKKRIEKKRKAWNTTSSQREIVTNLLLRYSLFNPFGHFLYDLYLFILQSLMCNYLW